MLEPVVQHPRDLNLIVADQRLPNLVTPLTVLAERVVTLGLWRARFVVIGESHFVQVWHTTRVALDQAAAPKMASQEAAAPKMASQEAAAPKMASQEAAAPKMASQEVALQEVLACVDLPTVGAVHHHLCADLADHTLDVELPTLWYQIKLRFHTTPPTGWADVGADGLALDFPQTHGQTPRTRIRWQCDNAAAADFAWQTLHSYPQADGTAVYVVSESKISTV
jgi:hypothetical protein